MTNIVFKTITLYVAQIDFSHRRDMQEISEYIYKIVLIKFHVNRSIYEMRLKPRRLTMWSTNKQYRILTNSGFVLCHPLYDTFGVIIVGGKLVFWCKSIFYIYYYTWRVSETIMCRDSSLHLSNLIFVTYQTILRTNFKLRPCVCCFNYFQTLNTLTI